MVIEKKYAYCSEPPVGGAKTPTQKKKKIFKNIQKSIISQKLRIAQKSHSCKKYKIEHISKTKIRTKKVIHAKNERHINSSLACKFGHFEKV